jgi:hypothetical protein
LQEQQHRLLAASTDGRLSLFAFPKWQSILRYVTGKKIGEAHLVGILDGLLKVVRDPRGIE